MGAFDKVWNALFLVSGLPPTEQEMLEYMRNKAIEEEDSKRRGRIDSGIGELDED
jgi:hypothetical protein